MTFDDREGESPSPMEPRLGRTFHGSASGRRRQRSGFQTGAAESTAPRASAGLMLLIHGRRPRPPRHLPPPPVRAPCRSPPWLGERSSRPACRCSTMSTDDTHRCRSASELADGAVVEALVEVEVDVVGQPSVVGDDGVAVAGGGLPVDAVQAQAQGEPGDVFGAVMAVYTGNTGCARGSGRRGRGRACGRFRSAWPGVGSPAPGRSGRGLRCSRTVRCSGGAAGPDSRRTPAR